MTYIDHGTDPERYAYRVHSEKRGNDRVTITEWNW